VPKPVFIFFIFFFANICGKTIDPEKRQLLHKAAYDLVLMPDNTMETLDYLEKNFTLDSDEKSKIDYLRIKSFFFQNNLNEALKRISSNDKDLPPNILILKRSILNHLSLENPSATNYDEANNDIIFSDKIVKISDQIKKNKLGNINHELSEIVKKGQSGNLMLARENLLNLFVLIAGSDIKSSELFLNQIKDLYKYDVEFNILYANYLVKNNELDKASTFINTFPKDSLEQTSNLNLKYEYYDLMVNYYSKSNAFNDYKEYIDKKESILKLLDQSKFSAKNKWFNIIESSFKDRQESLLIARKRILLYITLAGFVIITLILTRLHQLTSQINEYRNFIGKINILKERKIVQPQSIPEKTENLLLEKLEIFEKSDDCISPNISLQNLAKKLETNTKYLSEAINNHKQKNFNAYINELRINYIIDKLKSKPIYRSYKIKYLAEESGFSTHSAFTAVFKSVTGISPASYIQLLKEKEV